MTVFNLYMQILRKHSKIICVYIFLFFCFTAYMYWGYQKEGKSIRVEKRVPVYVLNQDEKSKLVDGFCEYLDQFYRVNRVDNLQSVPMFSLAIKIPPEFTKKFSNSNEIIPEIEGLYSAQEQVNIGIIVTRYFHAAKSWSYGEVENENDIEWEPTQIEWENQVQDETYDFFIRYCYYMSCALMAILIFGISLNHSSLLRREIMERSMVTPITEKQFTCQLFLGDCVFTLISGILFLLPGFLFLPDHTFHWVMGLFFANLGAFSLCVLALGYLIGNLVQGILRAIGVASCLAVTLSVLGIKGGMLKEFIPSYWYWKGNQGIVGVSTYRNNVWEGAMAYILIELGFAITLFVVALVVNNRRERYKVD